MRIESSVIIFLLLGAVLLRKYSNFSQLHTKKRNVFRNFDAVKKKKMKFYSTKTKNIATGIATVLLFFVLSAIYFAPQLAGEKLIQHDVLQYEGMCKDILDNRAATGEDAQWTGRMFGGMPAFLINVKYPAQAVKGTIGKLTNIVDIPISLLFFSMVAMWVAMLIMGVNPWVSLVAAIAYGFSTYSILIIGAGHITKVWAMVYAPPMVAGAWYTLRKNMWVGAALTALFTSLEIGANHPQITYYFLLVMATMWISEAIFSYKEKALKEFGKRTAILLAAGIIGVGSNLSPLWYTMQHTKETTRGGSELVAKDANSGSDGLDLEYATAWSYGKAESFNMFVPDFMGGASTDTFAKDGEVASSLKEYGIEEFAQYLPRYRGDQPYTAGPTYLGAAVIMLAVFALIVLPNRMRWWIVAASVLALVMSWGNNWMWLTELLFKVLPGYNKFRTLSMSLVVVQWTIPLLAALGIAYIFKNHHETLRLRRALYWATGITSGILLIMIIGGKALGDYGMQEGGEMLAGQFKQMLQQSGAESYIKQGLHEQMAWSTAAAMKVERAEAMQADAWRSLMFVLLAAVALWGYIERKVVTRPAVLCAILAIIVAADLINIDFRYLNYDNFVEARSAKIHPTEANKFILQDKDPAYRVLNLTVSPFNDATTSYFHRSVGGYHGAKLSRYQDLIDHHLSKLNDEVLDMLNVRYIINGTAATDVITRPEANGAAWMVQNIVRADSPHEEMALLGEINTLSEAVVSKEFLPENLNLAGGTISLEEYRPNYLRYEAEAEGNALAVFSEIYTDKGWTVTIDGEEATPLRANYILRAVEVPAGKHTIEWRYRAPKWGLIEGITLLFSLIVLVAVVLTILIPVINAKRQKTQA